MSTARKVTPIAIKGQHRTDTELELWICNRLDLVHLFAGVTTTETRRDRLKVVLVQRDLTEAIAGRMNGKPVTWRALFKQLYREELTT
jgi:hypothetical protein